MTVLEATHVTKRFSGITALDDVSIECDERELVGLIGPNGAGKTTLFDCISGKTRPDGGAVVLDGTTVTGWSIHRRARHGMARTFQRIELFGGMSVRDHMLVARRGISRRGGLARDLLNMSGPTSDELSACDQMLDLLGLGADANRLVDALSLGRGRIVELGRALMTRPRLLLLDEPSSGLDTNETGAMSAVLRRVMSDRGVAIVLVEHDLQMVRDLCDRLYCLDLGRVIASGPTGEVLSDDAVRRAYLGDPVR